MLLEHEGPGETNASGASIMSWFGRAFGYGFGAAAGRAIFGEERSDSAAPSAPVRSMTEAQIQADEKRFDEDAKRLEAEDKQKPQAT
jgi:hypothetical protein